MSIKRPLNPPFFSWENIHINDQLGLVEGIISEDAIRAHAFAIGDDAAIYLNGTRDLKPFVPPVLIVNDLLKLFLLGYDCSKPGVGGGLHTKAYIDYVRPAPVGETLSITGTHIAKFTRRGRNHRSCLSQAVDSAGNVLVRMLATETVGYSVSDAPDEGQPPEHWAIELPKVSFDPSTVSAPPTSPRSPGSLLSFNERSVSYEQSILFSGLPFVWAYEGTAPTVRQGLHTNPEIALKAGYSVPVAQGLISAAHLTSLLINNYGAAALNGGQLALSFTSPVLVGTRLSSHALVGDNVNVGLQELTSLHLKTFDVDNALITAGYARIPK